MFQKRCINRCQEILIKLFKAAFFWQSVPCGRKIPHVHARHAAITCNWVWVGASDWNREYRQVQTRAQQRHLMAVASVREYSSDGPRNTWSSNRVPEDTIERFPGGQNRPFLIKCCLKDSKKGTSSLLKPVQNHERF